MESWVHPELPTASVGSSQAPTDAVDNSAPSVIRPVSTYKSGNVVQTTGATSEIRLPGRGFTSSGRVFSILQSAGSGVLLRADVALPFHRSKLASFFSSGSASSKNREKKNQKHLNR